jgi:hypothetical protein
MANIKKAIEALVFEVNLDPESISEHWEGETIHVSFNGEVKTTVGNKHPAVYYIGYDPNTSNGYYMGYEDMTTNETRGRQEPTIRDCISTIKITIQEK